MKTISNKKQILVIDNQLANIQQLEHLLSPEHNVRAATSIQAACQIMQAQKPNLIILNSSMIDIDCLISFQPISELISSEEIPVIVLTPNGSEQDEVRALQLGAADFITYPIRPQVLQARVKKQFELQAKLQRHHFIEYRADKYLDLIPHLKVSFGFTHAEAQLANSLVNGDSLEKISGDTGLRYNTLKSYLKVIFQKTHTNKQHSLVSLLIKSVIFHT